MEAVLKTRGFEVVGDLLGLTPLRYEDRRSLAPLEQLEADREVLTAGRIQSIREGRFPKSGRPYFEITVAEGEGRLLALWFRLPVHLRRTFKAGQRLILFGRPQDYKGSLSMVHPEVRPWDGVPPPGEVRPIYPEIEGVRPGALRRVMGQAVQDLTGLPAVFPRTWLEAHRLNDPLDDLRTLHRPPADRPGPLPRPEESRAGRNLALFELLYLQLILMRSRARQNQAAGWACPENSKLAADFLAGLPFRLTPGQDRAWEEIRGDLITPRPMNRLLQGDVGSGKTVLALAAALTAVDGGRQAAVMAPTEILARQHYQTLAPHAERLGIEVALLVGGLPEAEKEAQRRDLASGRVRVVLGTHALISGAVRFESLGLAVIDEQHRFGVAQRLALRDKADHPDILIMTATPIPRSLAMTVYGDLDLSTIEGLPPGRQPVDTLLFGPEEREGAYGRLAEIIRNGGQAYVVAPRIEASDEEDGEDLAAAETLREYLSREVLPGTPVGLVHGRMKAEEQERVLGDFREGRLRVLTATTVIEVGLDVPAADMILIEGAERFGLAQLHQLRGRVGRGGRPAWCLLVAGGEKASASARLRLMARTGDGFLLAEEDLKLRGPGDATGVKQTGLPPLTWARLPRDLPLLTRARDLAREILEPDPELSDPKFKLVRETMDLLDRRIRTGLADVG